MTHAGDKGPAWAAVARNQFFVDRGERALSPSTFRCCCVALRSALAHSLPWPRVCRGLLQIRSQTNADFNFFPRSLPKHKGDFFDQKTKSQTAIKVLS